MNIYNQMGFLSAYSPDGQNIFNYRVEHVGFVANGIVYSPEGRFIGSVRGDWILDAAGSPVSYVLDRNAAAHGKAWGGTINHFSTSD